MVWLSIFCLAAEVVFPTGKLKLGKETLKVEIAATDEQKEHGLMFRKKLREDSGMIFIFDREQTLTFWMKNTFIDLDIGYFDRKKKLVDIQTMKAAGSVMMERPPSYPSRIPAMYALEVKRGWFAKHKIKIGDVFSLDDSREIKKPRPKSAR